MSISKASRPLPRFFIPATLLVLAHLLHPSPAAAQRGIAATATSRLSGWEQDLPDQGGEPNYRLYASVGLGKWIPNEEMTFDGSTLVSDLVVEGQVAPDYYAPASLSARAYGNYRSYYASSVYCFIGNPTAIPLNIAGTASSGSGPYVQLFVYGGATLLPVAGDSSSSLSTASMGATTVDGNASGTLTSNVSYLKDAKFYPATQEPNGHGILIIPADSTSLWTGSIEGTATTSD